MLADLISVPSVRKDIIETLSKYLKDGSNIVEVGATREYNSKGYQYDGHISLHLLQLAKDTDSILTSLDIDPYTVYALHHIYQGEHPLASAILADGKEWLATSGPIEVLVLDATDVHIDGCIEDHEAMYLAARPNLTDRSFLILDDVYAIGHGGLGKAARVLPHAVDDGFKYLVRGYTCLLARGL